MDGDTLGMPLMSSIFIPASVNDRSASANVKTIIV